MNIRQIVASAAIGSLACVLPVHAQIGVGPTLDPAFCNQKTFRETVIYIDDSSLVDGKTDWAQKLSNKLTSSLTPGERVSVVQLSPDTAQSKAIWSGCWPDYTADQRAEISKKTYIISRSPLDGLIDQQHLFQGYFAQALTKIYNESKKPAAQARINPQSPPKKQILRALASDDGRYAQNQKNIRAIIYSDLMENSELGSVYKAPPDHFPNYGSVLGSRFRRTVFYGFGVASDVDNPGGLATQAKLFWSGALGMMSAATASFGADLVVENRVPASYSAYELKLTLNGEPLEGKLVLLTDRDGELVDSWIGIERLSIVGLAGKFRCEGENCVLDAATSRGLVTTSDSESLRLVSHGAQMTGQIGVKSTKQYFDLVATPAKE
jgi:hypothetical protein